MTSEQQFEEWWDAVGWSFADHMESPLKLAFKAGYNTRSKEVEEDLRLFNGLMDSIDTEH